MMVRNLEPLAIYMQAEQVSFRGTRVLRMQFVCVLLTISLWSGCGEHKQDDSALVPRRFPLTGEVTQVVPGLQRVVIRHGAIEGWSGAANMGYPVRDLKELEKLSVGDEIRAVVFLDGSDYWLGQIQVTRSRSGVEC
jgi:Cu/Ag efflux protein CusF